MNEEKIIKVLGKKFTNQDLYEVLMWRFGVEENKIMYTFGKQKENHL